MEKWMELVNLWKYGIETDYRIKMDHITMAISKMGLWMDKATISEMTISSATHIKDSSITIEWMDMDNGSTFIETSI